MAPDPRFTHGLAADERDVMASVDEGREPRLVIADVSRDGAWLSVPTAGAVALCDWQ